VVLAVLAVVLRTAALLALPGVVASVAARHDLACTYERLHVSLLTGDAELWHLVVAPRGGGPEFADVEYCRVDVSVIHLLLGQLVARRLEVDGARLLVERNADGTLVIAGHLQRGGGGVAADASPADEAGPATGAGSASDPAPATEPVAAARAREPAADLELAPPLRIDAVRLQQVRLAWRDHAVDPPFELDVDLDAWLSHLASDTRAARFGVRLSAAPVVDMLELTGTGRFLEGEVEADVELRGAGVAPARVADYLRPLGIEPRVARLDLQARASASLRTTGEPPGGLSGALAVRGLSLRADDVEVAALDEAALELRALDASTLDLGAVTLHGLRAGAALGADGALRLGGMSLVTTGGAPDEATDETRDEAPSDPSSGAPALRIADLQASDLRLSWRDESTVPAVDQGLVLESLHVQGIDLSSTGAGSRAGLSAVLRAPGLLDVLRLDGSADLGARGGAADLRLALAGLRPDGNAPYLHAAGLAPVLHAGSLELALDARWELPAAGGFRARAQLSDVRYADGDEELLALGTLGLTDVVRTREPDLLDVGAVECAGLRLPVRRDEDGRWRLLGLALGAPAGTPPAAPPGAAPATARAPDVAGAPAAGSGSTSATETGDAQHAPGAAWRVRRVVLRDDLVTLTYPGRGIDDDPLVLELGGELAEVRSDARSAAGWPTVDSLRFDASSSGSIGRLALAGSARATETGSRADLELLATGLTAGRLAMLLDEGGPAPDLVDGTLRATLHATSTAVGDAHELDASVEGLELHDAGRPLLAVAALRVQGLSARADRTRVRRLAVEGARVAAERDADGTLHVAGLRAPASPPHGPPPGPPSGPPSGASPASTPGPRPVPSPATGETHEPTGAPGPAPATPTVVDELALDVALDWADAVPATPVALSARVEATVRALTLGAPSSGPASLRLVGGVDDAELAVDGQLVLAGPERSASLVLDGRRLGAAALAAYVPPGVEATLRDGRLHAEIEARLGAAEGGGHAATLTLGEVSLAEGGQPAAFELGRLHLSAPRLDPEADAYEVDEIVLAGLRLDVTQEADGSLRVPGLRLAAAPASTSTPAPSSAPAPASAPTSAAALATDTTDAAVATDAADAAPRPVVPLVRIRSLDLGVERLALRHALAPDAPPLVVTDLRLRNLQPILTVPEDPETSPPLALRLEGGVPPMLDALSLDLTADPLASNPQLTLDLRVRGLHGAGLMEARPDLADALDASGLVDGQVDLRLEVTRTDSRRHALAWDVAEGTTVDVALEDVSVRDGGGPRLLGLGALYVQGAEWRPRSRVARAELVEIVHPELRATRRPDGLHLGGLVIKLPEEEPAPAVDAAGTPTGSPPAGGAAASSAPAGSAPTGGEATGGASAAGGAHAATPPAGSASAGTPVAGTTPAGDPAKEERPGVALSIDELLADGADVVYVDETVAPPMGVWLNGLSADVTGLDTRTGDAVPTLGFDVLLNAGVLEAAAAAGAGGGGGGGRSGERPADAGLPAFQEIALEGRLQRRPELHGFVHAEVSALDLPVLRGPAAESGIELVGGTFDARVDLRFPGDGSLRSDSRLVFTDLRVTEPADGPISRVLRLPAPLGTVVFVLRDENGVIDIPLRFDVAKEGVSFAEVTQVAVTTLSRLIVEAIANSPFRVVGAVGDVAGMVGGLIGADRLFGSRAEPERLGLVTLDFAPARDVLDAGALAALDALADRLDDGGLEFRVTHDLGRGDRERAAVLANPPPGVTHDIVTRLRDRRDELLAEREQVAEAQRAAIAARLDARVEPGAARLRTLDDELGRTERALDAALERLRPNAERQALRRTQQACLDIAAARLDVVRAALLARADDELPERLRVERPRYREPARDGGGQVVITITEGRLEERPWYARLWARIKGMVGMD
jgi:hypothetical protein